MINFIHSALGWKRMKPAQKIAISFLFVILTGAFLLSLPISNRNFEFLNFIDALFTATSATCVTGLVTVVTYDQYNLFGQIVIISMIQIGGLGLMTLMAFFILFMKSRLSMQEKMAMKEVLNQDKVFDMRKFLMDIVKYTAIFEGIGAFLLSFQMIPDYGLFKGVWKAVFLSISAFCNAGFDIIGDASLAPYVHNPLVCFTIMSLIALGGLGFAVWFDVRDKITPLLKREISFRKFRKSLTLHTRLVLIMSAALILGTALLILLLEFQNTATIGSFTLPEKIMSSLFESVTLRTAGFATIAYGGLQEATKFLMMLVMFIGGSPGGTAGGIKTTTFAVLILFIIATFKGKEASVFKRTIVKDTIIHAMAIFAINIIVLLTGIFLLCVFQGLDFLDMAFEAVSAMATVGLTIGITPHLNVIGKLIIISLMFIGRIGIVTLVMSVMRSHKSEGHIKHVAYPNGNVIVG